MNKKKTVKQVLKSWAVTFFVPPLFIVTIFISQNHVKSISRAERYTPGYGTGMNFWYSQVLRCDIYRASAGERVFSNNSVIKISLL